MNRFRLIHHTLSHCDQQHSTLQTCQIDGIYCSTPSPAKDFGANTG